MLDRGRSHRRTDTLCHVIKPRKQLIKRRRMHVERCYRLLLRLLRVAPRSVASQSGHGEANTPLHTLWASLYRRTVIVFSNSLTRSSAFVARSSAAAAFFFHTETAPW